MSKQLRWTERARDDLLDTAEYISRDNQRAARECVDRIRARARLTTQNPLARRIVPEFGQEEIREVFVRSYRIVYRVHENAIDVLTVFEGHRLLDADR